MINGQTAWMKWALSAAGAGFLLLATVTIRHFQAEIDLLRNEISKLEGKIEIIRKEQFERIDRFVGHTNRMESEIGSLKNASSH